MSKRRTLGADHPGLVNSMIGVADVFANGLDYQRAVTEYRRALATLIRVKPDSHLIATVHNNLVGALQSLGRPAEAVMEYY